MAYNNYYQQYQPYPYYYQQTPFPQQLSGAGQGTTGQPQIQNGGFISVRSIEEAFNWPVAPGNSITFKDENSPYVYTKTKGFSQLEQPIFEKYRLVKEEDSPVKPVETQKSGAECRDYGSEISSLQEEVERLKTQISGLQKELEEKAAKKAIKKEADNGA